MHQKTSANMLYNYVKCPHRLRLDLFEDPAKRDPETAFVKLLWERGIDFEKQLMQAINLPYLDLSSSAGLEKEDQTRKALKQGVPLIYSGRISTDELMGEPDLLLKHDDGYLAGDIKSGSALEGENDSSVGKLKLHYAMQLGLYTDILEKIGISAGRMPFIYDIHRQKTTYVLNQPRGKRNPDSWWNTYLKTLSEVDKIKNQEISTLPAHTSQCKLCHWRTHCLQRMIFVKDLSLIPELGRKKRDILLEHFGSYQDFARKRLDNFISGKKTIFPGIGVYTLYKFHNRAQLLSQVHARAYAKTKIDFPHNETELFFDVETDPMQDLCYLHGFIERHHQDPSTEKYVPFFAEQATEKGEKRAFQEAWQYIQHHFPCTIYYYSPYEKTTWNKLYQKYPSVLYQSDLEMLFHSPLVVDLYSDVVRKKTEWPTYNYSVKDLAKYLGFKWRDENPSGAESIEWYHRWLQKRKPEIKQRILEYNEDDCRAMRVLLEGIRSLPLKNSE